MQSHQRRLPRPQASDADRADLYPYGRSGANRVGSRNPHVRPSTQAGFTLIELMIVVVIIGLLAAIAIPNYASMTDRSRRSSCLSNQRNLATHGVLYIADFNIFNGAVNCQVVHTAGYIPAGLTDCPNGADGSHDDYILTVTDGVITDVTCQVQGVGHEWGP